MPQPREPVELLVRDRVERADVAAVPARQLVEPDVGALGDEDEARHPRGVAGEALRLGLEAGEVRGLAVAGRRRRHAAAAEPQVEPALLLGDDVKGQQQPVEERVERRRPAGHDHCSRTYRSWPASDVGWARAGARSSSTSVSPLGPIGDRARLVGLERRPSRRRGRRAGSGRVVHEGAQRPCGRVLVRDPDQQQLLEADGRGCRPDVRETRRPRRPAGRPGAARRGAPRRPRPWPPSRRRAPAPRPAPRAGGRSRGAAPGRPARPPGRWARLGAGVALTAATTRRAAGRLAARRATARGGCGRRAVAGARSVDGRGAGVGAASATSSRRKRRRAVREKGRARMVDQCRTVRRPR